MLIGQLICSIFLLIILENIVLLSMICFDIFITLNMMSSPLLVHIDVLAPTSFFPLFSLLFGGHVVVKLQC